MDAPTCIQIYTYGNVETRTVTDGLRQSRTNTQTGRSGRTQGDLDSYMPS